MDVSIELTTRTFSESTDVELEGRVSEGQEGTGLATTRFIVDIMKLANEHKGYLVSRGTEDSNFKFVMLMRFPSRQSKRLFLEDLAKFK